MTVARATPVLDRPVLGITLMLGFCLLAPLADGLAKLATATVPVVLIVAIRFAAQMLVLTPLALVTRRPLRLDADVLRATAWRTVLHVTAIAALFAALMQMPLAEALAIVFVQPFLMVLILWAFAIDTVGPRRLAACAVGFGGSLMVIQPAFVMAGWVVLLPLYTAGAFTAFILITRSIAKRADPIVLQAVSGMMACVVLFPAMALGAFMGWPVLAPVIPSASDWLLLALIAATGTLAHLLMTWSLRFAPAATLAPIQYVELPFIVLVGWWLFREIPGPLVAAGIGLILCAGLYIVARERAADRTAAG